MKRDAPGEIHSEIEEKKRRDSDGSDGTGVTEDGVKLESVIGYLKGKGIKKNSELWGKLNCEARRRLKYLANGDEKLSDSFEEEFQKFLKLTDNKWSIDSNENKEIAVFWHSYENKNHLKVLRCQLSGLCYIHACVVLQHYSVAINESDDSKNVGMLDIGKYVGEILDAESLEMYLTSPHGGNTISILNSLCDLKDSDHRRFNISTTYDEDEIKYRNAMCDKIMKMLTKQPALVSRFDIMNNFVKGPSVSFTDPNLDSFPEERESHAMVLVGMRKTVNDEYYFLLQNWWRGRYFIEVSCDYFAACGPLITFVTKKLTQISPTLKFISFEASLETMADKCACNIDISS